MTRRRRGLALVEVMIAASLLMLIMTTVYSCFEVIRRHNFTGSARIDSRQTMRGLFDRLALLGRGSSYCFAGFTGTVAGQSYTVPVPGNSGTDLIIAVPMGPTSPVNFRIIALKPVPLSPPDPKNPNARGILWREWTGITATSDNAANIVLTSLPNPPTSSRVWAAYADPTDGFRIDIPSSSNGVSVKLHFVRIPIKGATQEERYGLQIFFRNQ